MSKQPGTHEARLQWLPSLALGILSGIVYLAWPSRDYHLDGIANIARMAEQFGPLPWESFFQICLPAHLLYDTSIIFFWKILLAFGLEGRALGALTVATSNIAAVGVFIFCDLVRRLTEEKGIAWICSLGLAFSGGYWMYAAGLEDILPSVVAWVFSFSLAVSAIQKQSHRLMAAAGAMAGISILLHNTSVVLTGSILILCLAAKSTGRLRAATRFLLSLVLATGIPLLAIGLIHHRFTGVVSLGDWIFFTQNLGLWGGRQFQFPLLVETLSRLLVWKNALWMTILGIFSLVLLCWAVISCISKREEADVEKISPRLVCVSLILWAVPACSFGAYWHVLDPEFFVPALPAFWLLLALGMNHASAKKSFHAAASLFVILLFAANLFLAVLPASDPKNNKDLRKANELAAQTASGDLVFTPAFGWPSIYAAYFTEVEVVSLIWIHLGSPLGEGEFSQRISEYAQKAWDRGNAVYFHGLPDNLSDGWQMLREEAGDLSPLKNFLQSHDPEFSFSIGKEQFYTLAPLHSDSVTKN